MLKLWLSAFGLESGAFGALAAGLPDAWAFLAFLLLHAGAAACIAVAAGLMFPGALRRPRRWLWSLLFGLAFFVPAVGLLCILAGVYSGWLFPARGPRARFSQVESPQFESEREGDLGPLRGSAIRAQLRDRTAAPERRVQALIMLGETAPQSAAPLLHEVLADPHEDMRMLAYGMLDRREKAISEQLDRARRELTTAQSTGNAGDTVRALRMIANLYWELVYQSLAQGDMERYALGEARTHARRALELAPRDGPTWMLLARVELRRSQLATADAALSAALACGVSREQVVPYLAELRFRQGRVNEVSGLMYELGRQPATGPLAALQQYWAAG